MFVFVLVLICVCYITSNTIGRHLDEGGLAPQHVTTHGTAGYHQVGQNNGPLCCYFRASGQNSDIIITLSDPISWRKAILYHTDDVLRHFFSLYWSKMPYCDIRPIWPNDLEQVSRVAHRHWDNFHHQPIRWAKKLNHIKVRNSCTSRRRNEIIHHKWFIWGKILVFFNFLQLNTLCTWQVLKITIHWSRIAANWPVFQDFTEAVQSILCENIQCFIRSMTQVLNFVAIKYS